MAVKQKPSFDVVQLTSMLDDFHEVLRNYIKSGKMQWLWFQFCQFCPTRRGWRGVEHSADGSSDSWKTFLVNVAADVTKTFSEQLQWRFENVKKFKWMDLVHSAMFSQINTASSGD